VIAQKWAIIFYGGAIAYAASQAASHASDTICTQVNGAIMYGWTIAHISGRAMLRAMLQQKSAVFGIAQHISSRSWSGGTISVTFFQIENI
jgi:hypothetical protein